MRRRRRSKYTWFPTLGTVFTTTPPEEDPVSYHDAGFLIPRTYVPGSLTTGATPTNGVATYTFPIVPDFTAETTFAASGNDFSLRDRVEGQDWLLKRLVGKIFLTTGQLQTNTTGWDAVRITAGFFVARAEDDQQNQVDLFEEEFNTMAADNVQDPWIWRRSWMLSSRVTTTPNSGFAGNNTILGAGIFDGPHIDSKVARRITREHRLWFVVNAAGFDVDGDPAGGRAAETENPFISGWLDLRVLGTMRRGKNKSSF